MTHVTDLHDPKAILANGDKLTSGQRLIILDRICQLERDLAAVQHEAHMVKRERDAIQALISNDQHALTFQTLSQYRASLVKSSTRPSADACTCPSGDGSLRWPCPVHQSQQPLSLAQQIADARAEYESWPAAKRASVQLEGMSSLDPITR